MLRLSKKADYALIAMNHLARKQGSESASTSARDIAERYDIPIELMAKVLQRLVRTGLLVSTQGTRGGYMLSRSSGSISVADVIQAIDGPFTVGGVSVVPVPLWHGDTPILGFRFGSFAYLTDCNRLDDAAWGLVAGVETLVIDALRDKPHTTHFTVAEALDVIGRVKPQRAYMTHMSHDLGHAATSARLPAGVELAYDGLVLEVPVDVE